MRKYRLLLSLVLIFFLPSIALPAIAYDRVDQVKAVFLFKFTGYISWPEKGHNNLILCTYKTRVFDELLNEISSLQENVVLVKHVGSGGSLKNCDLVYVENAKFLYLLQGNPILTVSDDKGFAKKGGMVEMHETDGRLTLIINLKKLEKEGLKASSRLLELAELIR